VQQHFHKAFESMRHKTESQKPQAKLRVSDFLKLKFEFGGLGMCILHICAHLLCLCINRSQYRCIFTKHDHFACFSKWYH